MASEMMTEMEMSCPRARAQASFSLGSDFSAKSRPSQCVCMGEPGGVGLGGAHDPGSLQRQSLSSRTPPSLDWGSSVLPREGLANLRSSRFGDFGGSEVRRFAGTGELKAARAPSRGVPLPPSRSRGTRAPTCPRQRRKGSKGEGGSEEWMEDSERA